MLSVPADVVLDSDKQMMMKMMMPDLFGLELEEMWPAGPVQPATQQVVITLLFLTYTVTSSYLICSELQLMYS